MITIADVPLFTRTFYFMRHGESEANLADTIAGSLDVALTELGHRQAIAAAALLKPVGITAIYTNALQRARETAAHVGQALDLTLAIIPELAERNWGELEGQPRSGRLHGTTPPDAETLQQYMQRVLQGLAKVDAQGKPLIVAHSGVFRVLCRTLGLTEPGAPYSNARPVRLLPPAAPDGGWRMEPL